MKKYKLIKAYPNSPDKGSIFIADNSHNAVFKCDDYTLTFRDLEQFDDYFEEIIEKDYEITAFNNNVGTKTTLRENGLYLEESYKGKEKGATLDWCLMMCKPAIGREVYTIYSVKRLSDGVEFKIGNKTDRINNFTSGDSGKIHKFYIEDNNLKIGIENFGSIIGIDNIQHAKQPLFKTEDDVDIYEGDNYYTVFFNNKDYSTPWTILGKHKAVKRDLAWSKTCKFFYTKEKAKEYIIMNKPCLSLQDLLISASVDSNDRLELSFNYMKNSIKQKLNMK